MAEMSMNRVIHGAVGGLRQNVSGPVVAIIGRVFGSKYRRTIAPVWRAARTA